MVTIVVVRENVPILKISQAFTSVSKIVNYFGKENTLLFMNSTNISVALEICCSLRLINFMPITCVVTLQNRVMLCRHKDLYRVRLTGSCFTKFDEDLTRAFAIYCGVSIFHVSCLVLT